METTYGDTADHSPIDYHSATGFPRFLLYYTEGHGPLWKIFWLWGVVLSWILFALYAGALQTFGLNWPLFIVSVIIMMPYTAWILVSVWMCAFNSGNDIWGYAARGLTVVWAVNVGISGGLSMAQMIM